MDWGQTRIMLRLRFDPQGGGQHPFLKRKCPRAKGKRGGRGGHRKEQLQNFTRLSASEKIGRNRLFHPIEVGEKLGGVKHS